MEAGRKRHIRLPRWINDTIETLARERDTDFTDVAVFLLADELSRLGYTKEQYDAKRLNLIRNEGGSV